MSRSKNQKHFWIAFILVFFGAGLALGGVERFAPFWRGPHIVPDFIVRRLLHILVRYHVSFLAVVYGVSCLLSGLMVLFRKRAGYRLLRINLILWIIVGVIGAVSLWTSGQEAIIDLLVPFVLMHLLPAMLIFMIANK